MENHITKHYDRFMAAGNGYLERKKLEDAERNFVSALKVIYKQEFKARETAVALKGLGFVYKERGRTHKNGEDLVKASGLFISSLNRLQSCNDEVGPTEGNSNDASQRSELLELKAEINAVHTLFIQEILGSQLTGLSNDNHKVENYKETLNQIRDTCRTKIKAIDELPTVDPDERDIAVELERVKHTRRVYAEIAKSMREFVTNMVEDCVEIMPSIPPCRYSILGLGSTAREEATPYSDLEFCILVENNTEDVLEYFTSLTNFLHLKVVELGETILPSLGIHSLNNYYSENSEDDWFYDSLPRGFSFDGAMPWASKIPTGRDKTVNKPWVESLIKTPQDMAALLSEKSVRNEGYRLADVLSTSVLICGDQSLFENYVLCKRKFSFEDDEITSSSLRDEGKEKISVRKERILEELFEVEQQYHTSLANYIRKTGGSYAIKKDLYRFPSLVVEYLGQYYNTESSSSWETIDKLESAKWISSDGAHNLRVALSIAVELRLRAYLDNQSQKEYFNDLLALVARHDAPNDLAMLLQRFFFTVVPLENAIKKLPDTGNLLHLKDFELYDKNPKIKAQMYMQFRQYYKATEVLQDVITEKLQSATINDDATERELAEICKIFGNALYRNENEQEAMKYYEIAMNINEKFYQNNPVPGNAKALGDSYLNYGCCMCAVTKEKKKALPYLAKALEIRRFSLECSSTTLEKITSLQGLVDSQSVLGRVYSSSIISDEVSLFFYHNQRAVKICEILQQEHNVFYGHHSSLKIRKLSKNKFKKEIKSTLRDIFCEEDSYLDTPSIIKKLNKRKK